MQKYELLTTRGYYGLDKVVGKVLAGEFKEHYINISGAELIKQGAIEYAFTPDILYSFSTNAVKEVT